MSLCYVHHKMNHIILCACFYVSSHTSFCVKRARRWVLVPKCLDLNLSLQGMFGEDKIKEITLNGVLEAEQELSRWRKDISREEQVQKCGGYKKTHFSNLK